MTMRLALADRDRALSNYGMPKSRVPYPPVPPSFPPPGHSRRLALYIICLCPPLGFLSATPPLLHATTHRMG